MSTTNSRKAIMRKELLERAATLFSEKGFAATSLQDVANQFGISRSAIYYYFENKDALLAALVDDVTVTAARTLERMQGQNGISVSQRLRVAVAEFVRWVLDKRTLFRLLDRNEGQLPHHIAERHDKEKRKVIHAFAQLIAEGVDAGEFRPVDEHVAAFGIIGMCNWTAWWFNPQRRNNADEVAETLANMAVNSLCRPEKRSPEKVSLSAAIGILREDLEYIERLVRP